MATHDPHYTYVWTIEYRGSDGIEGIYATKGALCRALREVLEENWDLWSVDADKKELPDLDKLSDEEVENFASETGCVWVDEHVLWDEAAQDHFDQVLEESQQTKRTESSVQE
jgi:hypothetical protein